jgi:hypothetical protein
MIEVVPCPGHRGCIDIVDSRGVDGDPLHLSPAEWAEFVAGVKAGHYDDVGQAAAE